MGSPGEGIRARGRVKSYRARYTPEAALRIRKLHPEVKCAIKEGIGEILASPLADHPLQFELSGLRSYRIRTYRIIYRLNEEEAYLEILLIGPRRTVYEELRALLLARRREQ